MIKESAAYAVRRSRLEGSVTVSGAKNSALRLLAASLLTSEDVHLTNFPSALLDAQIHAEMLKVLGKTCTVGETEIVIREPAGLSSALDWQGRSIRNTLLVLGALTARTGAGAVPLPGGCSIGETGDRKYDLHIMLLQRLGARVYQDGSMLCAEAPRGLVGTDIHLPIRSTGATENAILCGTLAKGVTTIWNPHIRPEIIDLIKFLRSMGADIEVLGQQSIVVRGRGSLAGTRYDVLPDNVEALTWLMASVITGGDVEIRNFPMVDLEVPLIFLRESGARFYTGPDGIIVRGGTPYPVEISTGPYPGINSDMQPLFAVYGACARGESRLIDLRFPGRYQYAAELAKMGVESEISGNLLKVAGGRPLQGARVRAADLRAGAALVLAGLVAEGETLIEDAWQIDRGYCNLIGKMSALGGRVTVPEPVTTP
jgi:UDP-N-acetylglucosamine 1-carboxyvinyltransferase